MEPPRRPRVLLLLILGTIWMGVVLGRLAYLELFHYRDYLWQARRQQQRIIEISPRRGTVCDRRGRELAMSISVDSCFAVPAEISDGEMVSRLLSDVLGGPAEEYAARLASSRSFVWIARKLSPAVVQRIQALNLRGIYFQKENQRFYPQRELAAHVLGYVDIDENGLGGIEYAFDKQIRGRAGRMMVLADARRRWYDRNEQAPAAGSVVVLTLDETIQFIAGKELAAAIEQTHAKAGTAVIQIPDTGELLAVANWPEFDANVPGAGTSEGRMDRAVSALYEPGSTFKIITLAAALDQNVVRPEDVVDCQMGTVTVAGRLIHDWKKFGLLTVAQVLAHSSDVGAIKVALKVGAPKFHDYIRAFGFGELTGVELPGESRGLLRPVEHWSASSIGSLAIGQEVGVTPVQLVTAVSAIANGGMLHRPHVVREIQNGYKAPPADEAATHRIIAATTAATLRRLMEGVVLEGTGKQAQLAGYTSAGKTGTAQKIDPATGRYSRNQYMSSFVGFAPVNNPAITMLVVLDSPVGLHHGGDVAAPVFRRIAEQVLAYLNVPHDLPVVPPKDKLQFARNHSSRNAEKLLATVPEHELLRKEVPRAPDAASKPGSIAGATNLSGGVLTLALAEGDKVAVPSLLGKSVRAVTEECSRLALNPVLIGSGIALEQDPEAGTQLLRGSRVLVRFGHMAAAPSRGK